MELILSSTYNINDSSGNSKLLPTYEEAIDLIQVTLTNSMLKRISAIDQNRFSLSNVHIPAVTANKLRKNSKKKRSYASNKIEGNPLTVTRFLKLGYGKQREHSTRTISKAFDLIYRNQNQIQSDSGFSSLMYSRRSAIPQSKYSHSLQTRLASIR